MKGFKQGKKRLRIAVLVVCILIMVSAFLLFTEGMEPFKLSSQGMAPTLILGDHIFINKLIYGIELFSSDDRLFSIRKPQRGDIIVFKYPKEPSRHFIKRIIAVEGDTIESWDKVIYINGKPIDEPYVQHTDDDIRPVRDIFGPIVVPEGKYFVMGDNRDLSEDSRFWGFVGTEHIKGKVMLIYWAPDSKRFLKMID